MRGSLGEMECTLADIYPPNRNPIKYLKEVMRKLVDFKKGKVIMAGDLNFCSEPGMDSLFRVQGTRNIYH